MIVLSADELEQIAGAIRSDVQRHGPIGAELGSEQLVPQCVTDRVVRLAVRCRVACRCEVVSPPSNLR